MGIISPHNFPYMPKLDYARVSHDVRPRLPIRNVVPHLTLTFWLFQCLTPRTDGGDISKDRMLSSLTRWNCRCWAISWVLIEAWRVSMIGLTFLSKPWLITCKEVAWIPVGNLSITSTRSLGFLVLWPCLWERSIWFRDRFHPSQTISYL